MLYATDGQELYTVNPDMGQFQTVFSWRGEFNGDMISLAYDSREQTLYGILRISPEDGQSLEDWFCRLGTNGVWSLFRISLLHQGKGEPLKLTYDPVTGSLYVFNVSGGLNGPMHLGLVDPASGQSGVGVTLLTGSYCPSVLFDPRGHPWVYFSGAHRRSRLRVYGVRRTGRGFHALA